MIPQRALGCIHLEKKKMMTERERGLVPSLEDLPSISNTSEEEGAVGVHSGIIHNN